MTDDWRLVRAPSPVQTLRRSTPTEWQDCQHEISRLLVQVQQLRRPLAPELSHVPRELQKVASQHEISQISEDEMERIHIMMRDMRRVIACERSDSRTRGFPRRCVSSVPSLPREPQVPLRRNSSVVLASGSVHERPREASRVSRVCATTTPTRNVLTPRMPGRSPHPSHTITLVRTPTTACRTPSRGPGSPQRCPGEVRRVEQEAWARKRPPMALVAVPTPCRRAPVRAAKETVPARVQPSRQASTGSVVRQRPVQMGARVRQVSVHVYPVASPAPGSPRMAPPQKSVDGYRLVATPLPPSCVNTPRSGGGVGHSPLLERRS